MSVAESAASEGERQHQHAKPRQRAQRDQDVGHGGGVDIREDALAERELIQSPRAQPAVAGERGFGEPRRVELFFTGGADRR